MADKAKKAATPYSPTKQMRRRALIVVLAVVVLFFAADAGKLAQLQIFETDDWQKRAVSQQLSDTVVTAKRGAIYDCAGQPLAESADVWKIIMSPKNLSDIYSKAVLGDNARSMDEKERLAVLRPFVAKGLTDLFGVDYDKVYKQTGRTESQYEVIKSKVEYNTKTAFSDWVTENGLGSAFYVITDYKRYYPQGTLCSTVLGFTGTDNNGLEGLESQYESVLAGTAGRIVTAQNGIGEEMPTAMKYTKVVDARDGNSLVLTIDSTVQMYAEKYLAEAVESTGTTNRGAAIVMNVNTGAILAMATKGDYDPNDPFTLTDPTEQTAIAKLAGDERSQAVAVALQKQWKNKPLTDTYEPGSVFKVFTTAMGLEESIISENTTFNCGSAYSVGGWRIKCHVYPRSHGVQNLATAISNSCNPYFVQVGLKIGAPIYYKYFDGFGFTAKTGVDMSGEASNAGLYHSEKTLAEVASSLATAAFGQTFKVTPIQMITAMSAIANGGKLMTPYVVDHIIDADGNVVSATKPTVKRQIISEETSRRICKIMEAAVNGGGAKNAYVAGYRIAGKTGTSEKRDITTSNEVVASFAGFAPADDPQVAVLVLLDQPQCAVRYGGTISAPVAQKIFEAILPHLGIEPVYTQAELARLTRSTPHVEKMALSSAQTKISAADLKAQIIGKGKTVVRQVPEAGQAIPVGGTVLLYTEDTEQTTVKVPNFLNKSVTEVNALAARVGLNVRMTGLVVGNNGAAVSRSQSEKAGKAVPKGSVITVGFLYSDTSDG